ncbi:unnamed protein product [Protopolystoma xenopodis]|uniref:Helicase C-terminal domain-containing protein n=1 Tax=Protopolystoma xenopodis TaxID=117903 RepID=A0A3S5AZI2_9PLAT|nr:unnamed protein product [Protopolystoma xenopodis]
MEESYMSISKGDEQSGPSKSEGSPEPIAIGFKSPQHSFKSISEPVCLSSPNNGASADYTKPCLISPSKLPQLLSEEELAALSANDGSSNEETLRSMHYRVQNRLKNANREEPVVWTRNVHYYRLDGSTSATEREKLINHFNDLKNPARLFLMSTRAGCLGVNLVGANRVVVFDASWNPCHDCQAVCRVYRYGQVKPCYIYRLVSDNTMEKKIYDRQVSYRVVDELNPTQNFTRAQVELLCSYDDKEPGTVSEQELEDCHNLIEPDPVLANVLREHRGLITKFVDFAPY